MVKEGSVIPAATVIVIETAYDTQYEFVDSNFPTIDGTGMTVEDHFLFQLKRIAASADDYGGDALLMTTGVHFQLDTLGSRAAETK